MYCLKEKIESLISSRKHLENQWKGIADVPASLGLSLNGVASDFIELSSKSLPSTKNAYLKIMRKTQDFTNQVKSHFKGSKNFTNDLEGIAKEFGHKVKRIGGESLRISNSNGPIIDVDFSGNMEFRNIEFSDTALEKYIDLVTTRFKVNDGFIVFKGGDGLTEAQNEELLKAIGKSMLKNDVDFKRLHVADKNLQHVIDDFTPSPLRVDFFGENVNTRRLSPEFDIEIKSGGEYRKSDKNCIVDPTDSAFNPQDPLSALAMKGISCIKFSGGNLAQFEKYSKVYELEHKVKISFAEKGDVVNFSRTDSGESISFRTGSIKEGGKNLRNIINFVALQKEKIDRAHDEQFSGFNFKVKEECRDISLKNKSGAPNV